jgi:hypothetical protein
MGSVAIFKGKLVKFLAKAGILIPKRLQSDRSLTPDQGETAFNTTTNKLEVYNGTSWQSLSESGTLAHPTSNSTFEYQTWNTLTAPNGPLTGTENTAIGVNAGNSITNGGHNTAIGYNAATAIGNSSFNTAIGSLSMSNLAGSNATSFGNTGIGWGSLFTLTSGIKNVGIGYLSGNSLDSTSSYNTCINTSGAQISTVLKGTVTIGRDYDANIDDSAEAVATANNDFVLGTSLHNYKLPGKVVTPVTLAAQNEIRFADADSSNYVGFKAQTTVTSNEVYELPTVTGTVGQVLGISSIPATGTTRLAWTSASGGTGTLVHPTTNSTFEYGAANVSLGVPTGGTSNTVIGVTAGSSLTTGTTNTLFGYRAGNLLTSQSNNVAIGSEALAESISSGNTAIGQYAGRLLVGGNNVLIGRESGSTLTDSAGSFNNTFVGSLSGWSLTLGSENVALGRNAFSNASSGSFNTFINSTGPSGAISGAVAIGKDTAGTNAAVTANNDFVLGTSLHNYKLPGTIVTDTKISVNSSSNALRITQTGTGNALVVEDSASTDTTPFVITNSGKVLMGSTTLPSLSGDLTIVGSNGLSPSIVLNRNSNDAFSTYLRFDKTRAGAKVENGDRIGNIEFSGDDGFDTLRNVADIDVFVDGSTAAGFPGRIVFSTSPINGLSAIERMRIDSAGVVTFTGSLKFKNALTTTTAASTIASATTIAPTAYITFVSGTTAIATITAPSTMTGGGGQIVLIPTGAWTTNTTGNIALATTAVVNRALTLTYDSTTTKWYPSY